MRKVIYKEWVRGVKTEDYEHWVRVSCRPGDTTPQPQQFVDGTNCYIEKEGLFHGFFPMSMENNDGSFGNFTEAWIELADGSMANADPSLIRFVDSPESDQLAEFAKAAMQGLLANPMLVERLEQNGELFHDLACDSISLANIMIDELKKQKP